MQSGLIDLLHHHPWKCSKNVWMWFGDEHGGGAGLMISKASSSLDYSMMSLCLQQEQLWSWHPNTEHLQELGGCSRNGQFTPLFRINQLSRLELGGFTNYCLLNFQVPWACILKIRCEPRIWKTLSKKYGKVRKNL